MKSMEKLYRDFYQKNIDSDKENEILNMVDLAAVLNMNDNGFEKNTVMAFLGSISPIANHLDKEGSKEYFDFICSANGLEWKNEDVQDNSKETRDKLVKIYRESTNGSEAEFENCYFDLDVKILSDLMDRGFTFAEVDNFFNDNSFFQKRVFNQDAVNNYIERVIEKMRSVRSEKSKNEIADADGRYKKVKEMLSDKYTEGKVISQTQKDGEIALTLLVVELIENILNSFDHKKEFYLSSANSKDYKITLLVRELFIEHINEQDIKNLLTLIAQNNDRAYAELVIDKVKIILKKENELRNTFAKNNFTPLILRRKSYVELQKEGLSAFDIYKIVLERKIYDTPSISNRLYEAFVDIDMAESCLSQYRDFDKDELKEIIKNSPRSILLSNLDIPEAKNYVENVISEAEKRLEKANKIQDEKNKMESLFTQEGDITKQGISNIEILKYPYEYSRSALKLLLIGKDKLFVQNTVLNMAIKYKMENPESFSQTIIESAVKIYNRMQNIKNYNNVSPNNNDAFDVYMQIMHNKYLQRNSLRESMDIEVIAEMILKNFLKQDIASAVSKYSPYSIEIGRSDNYVTNYLIPQAENRIVTAKNLLAKAKPLQRTEKKENISEEYKDLQSEICKEYPIIPYNSRMEELVVASLALEDFNLEDIKILLDSHSPFKDTQKNYGESMANRIVNIYLQKSA